VYELHDKEEMVEVEIIEIYRLVVDDYDKIDIDDEVDDEVDIMHQVILFDETE
jgi:hypothetical protein